MSGTEELAFILTGAKWFWTTSLSQKRSIVGLYYRGASLEAKRIVLHTNKLLYGPVHKGRQEEDALASVDITTQTIALYQAIYRVLSLLIIIMEKYEDNNGANRDVGALKTGRVEKLKRVVSMGKNKVAKKVFGVHYMTDEDFLNSLYVSDKLLLPLFKVTQQRVMLLNETLEQEDRVPFYAFEQINESTLNHRVARSPEQRQRVCKDVNDRRRHLLSDQSIMSLQQKYIDAPLELNILNKETLQEYVETKQRIEAQYAVCEDAIAGDGRGVLRW
mmetsp:Transcript_4432/g.5147  ORF Transcript_4432/g.5147 Transcript_4432/m.5147 type:complete len:275 (+) Transcript_4432:290-1114(+)|eukprot:CAMPEP_0184008380 /NCGR_PEP_ID=MMETSP0954-20121128/1937_1 /TAXON_ID=627963 /ORGANISM="Aplanochytrium sp, Strain PBS07" /LENGTH=274 /DNA_ID=CAMNT_0026287475 /DNA_START=442 /DNA_END=1266 /DNA_ORIENTATION=+